MKDKGWARYGRDSVPENAVIRAPPGYTRGTSMPSLSAKSMGTLNGMAA